jgi:hypothetical protein
MTRGLKAFCATILFTAIAQAEPVGAPRFELPRPPRPDPAPEVLPDEGPIPEGYHRERRARRGPIITGAVLAGITYTLGLGVALLTPSSDRHAEEVRYLVVPIAGPWIAAAAWKECHDWACLGDESGKAALVVAGLAQTTGAALIVVGLTAKKTLLVRDNISIAPALGPRSAGLVAAGQF